MIDWISVKDKKKPEYIDKIKESAFILLLTDDLNIHRGNYCQDQFVFWEGSFCNTDENDSQKHITHWAEVNLPNDGKEVKE